MDLNFGGLRGRGVKKQDPPIERDLYLSLEDLFFGCTKKIKISRRVSTWEPPSIPSNPTGYLLPDPNWRPQVWSLTESWNLRFGDGRILKSEVWKGQLRVLAWFFPSAGIPSVCF